MNDDTRAAIAQVEGRVSEHVLACGIELSGERSTNVFGGHVTFERGEVSGLALQVEASAAEGRRVALIAPTPSLGAARGVMRALARRRLAVVVHALAGAGEPTAEALALADLGWGMLFASSAEASRDLALVARRAAEDSGTPFVVVHDAVPREGAAPPPPSPELCEEMVGPPASRLRAVTDSSHPCHLAVGPREFAERVPFALGSAMRELEARTGRRQDAFVRAPAADAQAVVVGLGALGLAALDAAARLRARGVDAAAVHIHALRPLPWPRLVKALARASAVCVLEGVDEPLAQSGPLGRELKAAFADALTWSPGYPGIGRIPRVVTVAIVGHTPASGTLDPLIERAILADERASRSLLLDT